VTSADIVGQDRGAPPLEEEQLPGGLAGMWAKAKLNLRTGNLGPFPIIVGQIAVVIIFGFTATNFFTAVNMVNLINETVGTAMLAFGVVFVLLLGEIDLSIGYVAGIGALVVAELQLPGSGHQIPGLVAMVVVAYFQRRSLAERLNGESTRAEAMASCSADRQRPANSRDSPRTGTKHS